MAKSELPSSYKDPSGFVFLHKKRIMRQINRSYKDNYDFLLHSGLYQKLVDAGLLIPHQEIKSGFAGAQAYKIIQPKMIPFISYPYEWCFSQLKDAALLTLEIQKIALGFGMSLKDGSSFNVQFLEGKPIFIDTLSFEKYEEGRPWVAYKQFCEQFLGPLALAAHTDIRLMKLLENYTGSISLDLAAKLLPLTAKVKPGLLMHLWLHSRIQKKFSGRVINKNRQSFNRRALMGLVENLEDTLRGLNWNPEKSTWSDYYSQSSLRSYQRLAFEQKQAIIKKYLGLTGPKTLWDLGSNTGLFSRTAAKLGIFTVSLDNDPLVVEQNYKDVKKEKEKNILPLWIDILSPTASIGWENQERTSLLLRPLPDTIMALALVHHLAIANNLPLGKLAQFFAKLCRSLIIEFIPKEDQQVRMLLQNREDIFPDYNRQSFENEFSKNFTLKKRAALSDSKRVLYLMVNRKKL